MVTAVIASIILSFLAGALFGVLYHKYGVRPAHGAGPRGGKTRYQPAEGLSNGHKLPDFTALSSQILGFSRQVLDARGTALLVKGRDAWRVAACNPGLDVAWDQRLPLREGLLGLVGEGERDVAADPVHPQALGYLRAESAPLAVAVVPVLHRGEVRGLLAAHRESGRPFDERDSALLSRCARILDGWESFAAHGQRLEEMQGRQDRVVRGLQRMLLEPDPLEIAGLALDTLFDLLPALYGFAVIQHEEANLYALVTKRFQGPEHFERLERDTWSYWIMTRGRKSLYLEGATGKETAMPLLHAEESFPADRVAFLQPLATKEDPYGVVGLVGREDNPFPEEDRKEAAFFLGQAAALMELGFVNTMLQEQAMRDPLTGLFNRRHFGEQLEFELRRSRREKTPVSLLIADIDHFKKINDTYGHPMGDRVLRDMAACISGAVREVDITCRYGGEEFAVILPSCPNGEAARVGERIREVVEASHFPREGADRIKLTVSLGLSSSSSPSANAEELVHLADKALYRAKREGRNRLSSHP